MGEILDQRLRLIAFALNSGSVIADRVIARPARALSTPAISGPLTIAQAMSRSFNSKISPLAKSMSGFLKRFAQDNFLLAPRLATNAVVGFQELQQRIDVIGANGAAYLHILQRPVLEHE